MVGSWCLSNLKFDRWTALKLASVTSPFRFFCWHMLASVSRVVRRRQPGPAQRWFSASSVRKQANFSSPAEDDVQEDAKSQPEFQARDRDAREDPTYEQWLATIGRQYKRTDRRNWLGGPVVRPYFALDAVFYAANVGHYSHFR